jgi:hypothetical protein
MPGPRPSRRRRWWPRRTSRRGLRAVDEADTAFAQAAAVNERIHSPIELARTHIDCARMLASRAQPGDSDRARALLHPALTTASDLGLVTIELQAQTLLSKPAANCPLAAFTARSPAHRDPRENAQNDTALTPLGAHRTGDMYGSRCGQVAAFRVAAFSSSGPSSRRRQRGVVGARRC